MTPLRTGSQLALLLCLSPLTSAAPDHQEPRQLRQAAEAFLQVQTAGLPGSVSLSVGPVDPRLNLPACAALEPFLPSGARAWGKTTVGIRCTTPAPWTIYLPATVKVIASYQAAASALKPGQTIQPADLVVRQADVTELPAGIVSDPAQAVGRTLVAGVPAGNPLRVDALRTQTVVQQGQTVKVVSAGAGFSVSSEGRALANATEGQVAQARTAGGAVVSGIARMGAIIEVVN